MTQKMFANDLQKIKQQAQKSMNFQEKQKEEKEQLQPKEDAEIIKERVPLLKRISKPEHKEKAKVKWKHDMYEKINREHEIKNKHKTIHIEQSPGYDKLLSILTNKKAYIEEISADVIVFTDENACEEGKKILISNNVGLRKTEERKIPERKGLIFSRLK